MTAPPALVYLTGELGHGGSERQLFLLLKHLDPQRWARHVVVFNPTSYPVYNDALRRLGVTVWELPREVRGIPRRLLWLVRLLRRLRPRVVHSWTVHDNAYAALAGLLARVPLRWGSLRGSLHSDALRRMPAIFRWLCLRGVGRLVVNSQAIAGQLAAAGYPAARVSVLANGVELGDLGNPADRDEPDFGDLGIPPGAPVAGIVGNLRRVKNHLLFVRAMAQVLPAFPDARAVIVGQPLPSEPHVAAELEAEIARLGLGGRVLLAGFRGEVPALMRRFTVLCLSSHSEGLPNVVLEAMAAGRPVVATRVGGVPELVRDGVTGLLVAPGDVEGFAAAVRRLLAEPDLAARLGEAGRELASGEHSCAAAAATLGGLYLDALAARGIQLPHG